jgi:hypothetical protein
MTRTEYVNENRTYLGDSVDLLEAITDEQFQLLLRVTIEMGNSDPGIDNSLVKTHETLADFESSSKDWWACSWARIKDGVVYYSDVQMHKGAPRISEMAIVDLGEFRVVLT